MNHFKIQDLPTKQPAPGVLIRLVPGEKMTFVYFEIAPGAEVREHSHPHEQIGMLLEGTLDLTVEKETRTVRPGEAYHIPSNLPHKGLAKGGTVRLIEVFAPPREDFLKL